MFWRWFFALLLFTAACGEDPIEPPAPIDGGIAAPTGDAGNFVPPQLALPVTPLEPVLDPAALMPEPPAAPVLTPCPDGWRIAEAEAIEVCEPWPESGRAACPLDQEHFPGQTGCRIIGSACDPSSEYAINLPSTRILYVRPSAPGPGTGTRADPFPTIAAALALQPPAGTTIALAKGTYDEVVIVREGVVLWGACTAETLIASSSPHDFDAAIQIRARGATIRNLRVSGARPGISAVSFNTGVRVEDVIIENTNFAGMLIGGSVDAYSLVIRGAPSGALVAGGGSLAIDQGAISGFSDVGLQYEQLALGELHSVYLGAAAAAPGVGLSAGGGAQVSGDAVIIENTAYHGAYVEDGRTRVVLRDSVIRSSVALEADQSSTGAWVRGGATIELERARIANIVGVGLYASDPRTRLSAVDTSISDVSTLPGDTAVGVGLFGDSSSTVAVSRMQIVRSTGANLALTGGARATIRDLVLREGVGFDAATGGTGLIAVDAEADISRAELRDHRDSGVLAFRSRVHLSDVRIQDTTCEQNDPAQALLGQGIAASESTLSLSRCVLENNRSAGIVAGASRVDLMDVRIADHFPAPGIEAAYGQGLIAVRGSSISIDRSIFERNGGAQLQLQDRADEVPESRARIYDTIFRHAGAGPSTVRGYGLFARRFASLDLRRTRFDDHGLSVFVRGAREGVFVEDLGVVRTSRGPATEGVALDGIGFYLADSGMSRVVRARISESAGLAMAIAGTAAEVDDVVVLDTRAASSGLGGRAIEIRNATVAISRVNLERSGEFGLGVFASAVELKDLIVRDVRTVGASAVGLAVLERSRVRVTGFEISDSAVAGLMIAGESALELRSGVVHDNAIGVSVGVEGLDVSRLSNEVFYFDNGVNFDLGLASMPEQSGPVREE